MIGNEPVSVIFLAHNEADSIEMEIRSFHDKIVSKLPGSEFIVAEDGSIDGTTEIIKRLVDEIGIIHITSHERKGYIKALGDAVNAAQNKYVFLSDTGLKHNPDDFWNLYMYRNDADLIVGRKKNRTDRHYRRIFTYVYNFYLRIYFKASVLFDADSGFRLFNRKVADLFFGNPFIFTDLIGSEMVLRSIAAGLKYREVDISYQGRKGISRGLPFSRIPRVIIKVIKDLIDLKKEFKKNGMEI